MPAVVAKCNCKHDFQDSEYGVGNRIHNTSEDLKKGTCTVCGNTKEIKGLAKEEQKKGK